MKTLVLIMMMSAGCRQVYPCDGSLVMVNTSEAVDIVGHAYIDVGLHVWDEFGCRFRTKDTATSFELDHVLNPILEIEEWSHTPSDRFGEYDYQSGKITIDINIFKNVDPGLPIHVVAHEVGHAMGLDHVPAEKGPAIMNPVTSNIVDPTDLDSDEWCKHWCGKHY